MLDKPLIVVATVIFFCLLIFAVSRVINGKNNLEWAHLISERGIDGKQWTSWKRIGEGGGVLLCVWLPLVYTYSEKMDSGGLALVMGVSLGYLFGGSAYAATLRAKQGGVETVLDLKEGTETITETAPIKTAKGVKK